MARRLSLRAGLILSLAVVVVLVGAAVQATTFLGAQQAVRGLSRGLVDGAADRAEAELEAFLEPLRRQLVLAGGWAEAGLLDPLDPERIRSLLAPVLQTSPQLAAAVVADAQGNEAFLLRQGSLLRLRQTRPEQWPGEARWLQWQAAPGEDAGADVELIATTEESDYDARSRPWFRGAVDRPRGGIRVFATAPYVFFTSQKLGVTTAVAVSGPNGDDIVVAFDVHLEQLRDFVNDIQVSDNGSVAILTDQGNVLAIAERVLPPGSTDEDWLLKLPMQIDSPLLQAANDAYTSRPEGLGPPRRFRSGDQAWWGQVRPARLAEGSLFIVVLVPESDLLTDRAVIRRRVLIVTVSALLLALLAAFLVGGSFSRPIEALVRNSDRMSTGDLERGEAVTSAYSEIQTLAEAQVRMRNGLKSLMKLEGDLQVARQIQRSTLPEQLPEIDGWDLAASNRPADETGGDTYDAIALDADWELAAPDAPSERVALLLADATGHGIGPALSVTQLRSMLRGAIHAGVDLSTVASQLNDQLVVDLPRNRFITAWLGVVSKNDGNLRYVSAGQGPLLLYRSASAEVESLLATAPPLGLFPDLEITMPEPIELAPGDIFVVLSDGFFEAESPDGEELGEERVSGLILSNAERSAADILGAIKRRLENFTKGVPANDDQTAVVIKKVR